ncbi:MAG: Mini-ribonuclease 3 [Bacilli bacterium]|nr:Mini-ribonuclease 3 [Bacilli bacterium]
MNNLVMAYLGDAVYELHIRKFLISRGISKVGELQKKSIEYVSAKSQRRILEELINRNFLTTEEIEIVNRGRNANSHPSKTTDIITYKKATGLECLIGNLYEQNIERCNEILNYITGEL